MERLTERDENGNVSFVDYIRDKDTIPEKVAEYEDTNLEPHQIQLIQQDNKLLQTQNKDFREEILRLREECDQWHRDAVKANAELGEIKILEGLGLRITLPCKVGATVYDISDGEIYESKADEITILSNDKYCIDSNEYHISDFGKTAFLSEEEAIETLPSDLQEVVNSIRSFAH